MIRVWLVAPEWLECGSNDWNALPFQQENAKTGFSGAHFFKRWKPKRHFNFIFSSKFLLCESLLAQVLPTHPIHSFFFLALCPLFSILICLYFCLKKHHFTKHTSFLAPLQKKEKETYSLIQTVTRSMVNSSLV